MFFKDKNVLIIGGTGTIGKSILSNVLQEKPKVVRVLSRSEYNQFLLQEEFRDKNQNIRYLIGDIRNYDRVFSAMENIDYVFHVAAMKHVSFCEYNPFEAVLTNIFGTQNVIRAAIAQKVKKVVFTSSDKAISPTNNYGATKLTAERLITSAEYSKGSSETIFASVRFGNVMGSRGSVIPLFENQIKENQKITVTDLSMSRFMMTLNQATMLTIEAMKIAKGGETFILKMPVISLKDLSEVMIEEVTKLYGLPKENIKIEEIGLKPGEKMYEELMTHDESLQAFELPDMFIIPSPLKKGTQYENAERAKAGFYRSDNQNAISKEELRNLILNQQLLTGGEKL
ncbi:membrane protein [Bacillus sp. L_1B0_8]|uniref:SDR family NAD(P)-dependent oxidoreductase n=1 Tax=Bacillus TaxID=1386 RepID=UPI0005B725AD|nr:MULTISPECIES: SDR family NAD(P)-dependent oxidoreductase [unclassified Bacillus (in: firmicutes)]KIQ84178.1 membrane protein [Bacillus sp. L_1B0_5]KIQ87046.1 membrane protein [Bacillus sp. L_1B0_8]